MARKRDRIFALVMAIVFFVTAFGFSFYVIWLIHSNNSSSHPPTLTGTKLSGFKPLSSIATLQTIDQKVGTGAVVKPGDTVTVDYTGAVASTAVIFQSTLDNGQAATLNLNEVIKGWQLGIPGMRVGGIRRLLIPSGLAYGASPPQGSNIPANADLVFDIILLKDGN